MPSRETMEGYSIPTGFTRATELESLYGPALNNVADYIKEGKEPPEPKTYAVNNGTIAAITSSGDVIVYVPMTDEDGQSRRTVSYDQAIANLEDSGYTEAEQSFNVPFSNI